ncbi:hypothetical protein N9U75_00955 [Pelagibacteraceae bacterium]|nr:hypothetical protein [Pelagibacteraceae bacterium]
MIYRIKIYLILFFFLLSCSNVDFVYKDNVNLTSPLYNKTSFDFSGKDLSSLYRYASRYFGDGKHNEFILKIFIEEKQIKRSVRKNQSISKQDFELLFKYKLIKSDNNCVVLNKEIFSNFSYVPKSSGYNFGSDQSLKKMYELTTKNNLEEFSNFISGFGILDCKNES